MYDIKKVLFVVDKIEIGGATTLIANKIAYLHKKGIKTVLFGAKTIGYQEACEYFPSTKIISYGDARDQGFKLERNIIQQSYSLIPDILHKEAPDIIHFIASLSGIGVVSNPASKPIPKVYEFAGAWDLEVQSARNYFHQKNSLLSRRIKDGIRHKIQQRCIQSADKVIVFSDYAKNLIINHFSVPMQKIKKIPGSVDSKVFTPPTARSRLKKELSIDDSELLLVLVSRPDPRKGIHVVLDAALQLVLAGVRFKLIIGLPYFEGAYFESLWQHLREIRQALDSRMNMKLGESIHFVLASSHETKLKLMKAADVFLMASTDLETFGLTTIEAMACS